MKLATGITVLSIFVAGKALYAWNKRRLAAKWPVVTARVVKTSPQTLLERRVGGLLLNMDSDHFLEWKVSGQTYRELIPDESFVSIGPFKIWRKPPSREPAPIRYNPKNPAEIMPVSHDGWWKVELMIALVLLIVAFIVSLV